MKSSLFVAYLHTVILFLLLTNISFPQEPKITWGEIPKSDLEMKSYPADTNASAVILYDRGESLLDDNVEMNLNRHLRVKILNSKGYEWGTQEVDLYNGSSEEKITNIEGVTYWLESDGQVKSSKLSSKDIYHEKISAHTTRFKFTLPSLKPGCVIEIKYTIITPDVFNARGWTFQYSEPVVWSEFSICSPTNIAFSCVTTGYEQFVIRDNEETTQIFSGEAESLFHTKIMKCRQYRWAVSNAPAMREEPYITTIDDYKNKVDVQLMGYSFNGMVKEVMNGWPKAIEEFLDNKYFGSKIEETSKARKLVKQITENITSPEQKVKAIYNWITSSIVCTNGNRLYADQDINDVIDSKKGNGAEITFLFLSMLKCAGINGDPVILSTRENGKIQTLYPIVSQFNCVLAKVKLDSISYFVDATDPLRPIDLLPTKVLNVKGLVIKKDTVEWVTLASNKKTYNVAISNLNLSPDGSIKGSIEDYYKDYGAMIGRRKMKEKTGIEFAKESFDANKTGIIIDSAAVFGKDTITVPFKVTAQISLPNYAQCNGDIIYLNPHVINRLSENPFKTRSRKFPIDYAYGRSSETIINIVIPDSFEVKDPLLNRNFSACSDGLSFLRYFLAEGKKIQLRTKLEIKKSLIQADFYSTMREFYEKIVACEQEQIVLTKIKKAPEPVLEQNNKPATAIEPVAKTEPEKQKTKIKKKK